MSKIPLPEDCADVLAILESSGLDPDGLRLVANMFELCSVHGAQHAIIDYAESRKIYTKEEIIEMRKKAE